MKRKLILAGFMLALTAGMLIPTASCALSSGELSVQQEYNKARKLLSTTYVDRDGNIAVADDKGYATERHVYDHKNRLQRTEYLDDQGNLVNILHGGYAVRKLGYDASARVDQETYLNANGQPVIGPDGYAERKWLFFFKKKIQDIWNYDEHGNLLQSDKLYANYHAKYRKVKNNRVLIEEVYTDANGNLFLDPKAGFAHHTLEYEGYRVIREDYYDEKDQPYLNPKVGFARVEHVYTYGRLKSTAYYDQYGQPVVAEVGYARLENTFSSETTENKPLRTMMFDAEGKAIRQKDGSYGRGQLPDSNGFNKRVVYYGQDGLRGYCDEGYSRIDTMKNGRGM